MENTLVPSPEVINVVEGPVLNKATVIYEDPSAGFAVETPIVTEESVTEATAETVYAGEYAETSGEYTDTFESPMSFETTDSHSTSGFGAPELGPNEVVIEDITIASGADATSSNALQPTPVGSTPAGSAAVDEANVESNGVESISDVFSAE